MKPSGAAIGPNAMITVAVVEKDHVPQDHVLQDHVLEGLEGLERAEALEAVSPPANELACQQAAEDADKEDPPGTSVPLVNRGCCKESAQRSDNGDHEQQRHQQRGTG